MNALVLFVVSLGGQPLATPAIGGMLSSLVHILIVTPVIFVWLRARELKQSGATASG